MKQVVVMATEVHEVLRRYLIDQGWELQYLETQPIDQIDWAHTIGLVISNKLKVDRSLMDRTPLLRWIARLGSGMEIVDMTYAQQKDITCISSPDGNSNAVAEHALGLLLSLSKNIYHSAKEVQQEQWLREENRGFELMGRTVGLVGFGHTGCAFARKLHGMGMNILAYDIEEQMVYPEYVQGSNQPDTIWEQAEVISFHVPLNHTTRGMMNKMWLEKMNRPFYLLNTSRGEILEKEILIEGLESGKIRGLGLDVWQPEPPDFNDVLWQMLIRTKNVIMTPHIAGYSFEAQEKMGRSIIRSLKVLLDADLSAKRNL